MLGKHILHQIINGGKWVKLEDKQRALFDIEFNKIYLLLNEMKQKGIEISKTNLEIYSQITGLKINNDYPEDAHIGNIEAALRVFLQKREREYLIEQATENLTKYKKTGLEHYFTKYKQLSRELTSLNGETNEVKTMEMAKLEQLDFIRNVFNGKEVDGLYLYRENKSRQFIRLNYLLKYIGKEDLVVIGGTSSVGKTSFMLSLINVLGKNGYKGLMFSLEQTAAQLIHRMTLAKGGLSNNQLFALGGADEKARDTYHQAIDEMTKLPLVIVDGRFSGWLEMKEKIIEMKDEIDYIAIDHLTYIRSYDGTPMGSLHQMYSEIVRDLKDTAKELKIPILLLAQFNRSVGGQTKGKKISSRYKEPFMDDFRETGSIEEYADKVLLLYRVEDKNNEWEKYNTFRTIVKVDKNRTGALGQLEYNFFADTNRWSEIKKEGTG